MGNIFQNILISRPKRNVFNMSHERKLTTQFGRLTPIFLQDMVPGDTFKNRSEIFIRFAPLISPVMHRINVYTHFFFVPNRLVMPSWTDYITGNDPEATLPMYDLGNLFSLAPIDPNEPPVGNNHLHRLLADGSLADYFGIPTLNEFMDDSDKHLLCQVLPFLGYQLIYNEYYRDQNLEDPVDIDYENFTELRQWAQIFRLRSRSWEKDYFTSALPWAQKGDPVQIPGTLGGNTMSGYAPIVYNPPADGAFGYGDGHTLIRSRGFRDAQDLGADQASMGTRRQGFNALGDYIGSNDNVLGSMAGRTAYDTMSSLTANESVSSPVPGIDARLGVTGRTQGDQTSDTLYQGLADIDPNGNLWADLNAVVQNPDLQSGGGIDPASVATGNTINDLRTAFQIQRWLEKNARAGTRYIEQILSHFGVRTPDSRLQRPEFLGGGKNPVQIGEVLQTSESTGDSPQANPAGRGISSGNNNSFKYKALEHGYVIGLMSIVPKSAYQQGVPRHFLRNNKFDFYWPTFAHLGEQPVFNQELYHEWDYEGEGEHPNNKKTFGYQPRYTEYKYVPSTVHGSFRNSLMFWHLGRKFDRAPVLNDKFIRVLPDDPNSSDEVELNRIFGVIDPDEDPLLCQVYNRFTAVRPIPKFSDPGYADH